MDNSVGVITHRVDHADGEARRMGDSSRNSSGYRIDVHGSGDCGEAEVSRSQAVREEALRLDGNRCQITGFDGRSEEGRKQLEVHHVEKLGIGGSDERDVVENCITLHAPIHVAVETGQLVIARWERPVEHLELSAGENGSITAGKLEVIDNQNVLGYGVGKVDHSMLWFYRKHDAEEGEEILTQLATFAQLDSTIAERVYRLGQVVDVTDPASRTLRECLASNGLDTRRLISAANLWEKSLDGLEWPEGMTVSDYRKLRLEIGNEAKREYFYIKIPARSWLTGARPEVYYRTAYEAELRDTMEPGDMLYKLGKTVYGLRAEGGKLFYPDRREADVVHFVPEKA